MDYSKILRRTFSRRSLLRGSLQSIGAAFASGLVRPNFVFARGSLAPQFGRSLVVLMKEGGEDTAYSQPPLGSVAKTLASVRPSLFISPSSCLDWLNGEIGLHPLYAPLQPIVSSGQFKIVRACGFPSHSRSHQEAQNHLSHAARHLSGQQATEGWPAKLKNFYQLSTYQVVGFRTGNSLEMKSQEPSLVVNDYDTFSFRERDWQLGDVGGSTLSRETLLNLLLAVSDSSSPIENAISKTLQEAQDAISVVSEIRATPLQMNFPKTELGLDLSNVAKMMRWRQKAASTENALYFVKVRGYDTHSEQAKRLSTLIAQEAEALRAFYEELKAASLWQSALVMTVSEFSRTFQENSAKGTEHAEATNVALMGGQINGKGSRSVYGPQVSPSDIQVRNAISPEVPYQSVVEEILRWWGASDAAVAATLIEHPHSASSLLGLV
jgi:uncharacterized protein (DUF1501 family)